MIKDAMVNSNRSTVVTKSQSSKNTLQLSSAHISRLKQDLQKPIAAHSRDYKFPLNRIVAKESSLKQSVIRYAQYHQSLQVSGESREKNVMQQIFSFNRTSSSGNETNLCNRSQLLPQIKQRKTLEESVKQTSGVFPSDCQELSKGDDDNSLKPKQKRTESRNSLKKISCTQLPDFQKKTNVQNKSIKLNVVNASDLNEFCYTTHKVQQCSSSAKKTRKHGKTFHSMNTKYLRKQTEYVYDFGCSIEKKSALEMSTNLKDKHYSKVEGKNSIILSPIDESKLSNFKLANGIKHGAKVRYCLEMFIKENEANDYCRIKAPFQRPYWMKRMVLPKSNLANIPENTDESNDYSNNSSINFHLKTKQLPSTLSCFLSLRPKLSSIPEVHEPSPNSNLDFKNPGLATNRSLAYASSTNGDTEKANNLRNNIQKNYLEPEDQKTSLKASEFQN